MNDFYRRHIMPAKALLDGEYMARATFWSDLRMILDTCIEYRERDELAAELTEHISDACSKACGTNLKTLSATD